MEYKNKQKIYRIIMLVILTITITFMVTAISLYNFWGSKENLQQAKEIKYIVQSSGDDELSTEIKKIKALIDKHYLGDINESDMIDNALMGYVYGLDDEYSEYIPRKDMEEFNTSTYGNYVGVGIYYGKLKADSNEIVVISPIKDSPAYKAGILPGDIILKIDDKDVSEYGSLTEMSNNIKGKEGTVVKLTIKRDEEIKEYNITRETIKLHEVHEQVFEDDIGYLEVSAFEEETANDFSKKLDILKSKGIKSLIIDLRNNGGGIVDEATKMADNFLKKDATIFTTRDKNNNETVIKAKTDVKFDLPIVILTNEATASASEIFAAALKDNSVAKIVGNKTYGKGVIQNIYNLTNGAALKITVSEYFTPNNNKINKVGIEPDVEVSLDEKQLEKLYIPDEEDAQLQKAIELLKNKE